MAKPWVLVLQELCLWISGRQRQKDTENGVLGVSWSIRARLYSQRQQTRALRFEFPPKLVLQFDFCLTVWGSETFNGHLGHLNATSCVELMLWSQQWVHFHPQSFHHMMPSAVWHRTKALPRRHHLDLGLPRLPELWANKSLSFINSPCRGVLL
jgi:hypothetical protein